MIDRHQLRKTILLLALSLSAACLIFSLLAKYDNKYTYGGAQPIGGLLAVDQEELEQAPVRFLIYDWEFYPGLLLSPEDFQNGPPDVYRQLVSIGRYSSLSGGVPRLDRHGQGTYRLVLDLPEQEQSYSVALPEIYSACRFYADGRMLVELGCPDREDYRPGIQNKIVTFFASGRTELLLAVSDYSAYYSGMVFPPAFGDPQAVNRMQNVKLLISETILLLALFGTVLSLYLGLRLRLRQCLFFALLCFCYLGQNSYPLLHTYFLTGVQPWYTIEIVCIYGLMASAAALQNALCQNRGRCSRLTVLMLGLFCVVSAVYALTAALRGGTGESVFSALSALCKWWTAFYLIYTSARHLYRHDTRFGVITAASAFFAVSLLADRIFPLYEPVYGGWFGEAGAAVLILGLACVLWTDLADAYRFRLSFAEEKRQMKRILNQQHEHHLTLSQQIEEAKAARHDLHHHIIALRRLAEKGELNSIKSYLDVLNPNEAEKTPLSYTANQTADAVLQYYGSVARRNGIYFDAELELPESTELSEEELSIVLGNLLENAVEAGIRQKENDPFIYLRGRMENSSLALIIENSYSGEIHRKGDRFLSSKREGTGLGVQSVCTVVSRHGGLIEFDAGDRTFHVSLLLPLDSSRS